MYLVHIYAYPYKYTYIQVLMAQNSCISQPYNCVGKEMLIACGVAIAIGTPLAAIGVPIIHHSALLTTASFYCHIALR